MKKITYLLIAAMSLVSVASCVKEMTPEEALDNGVTGQVFTISLPAATRTELVDGKTVWAKGDSVWVSNGAAFEAVVVPEEAYGKKEFDFATKTVKTSEENPQIWVVYPYDAAAGVKDGKVSVKVPGVQYGQFASANIAAAVSYGYHVELKNVTAVMKVTVPDDAVLYSVAFTAAEDKALAGTCEVDFSGATPVLTASAPSSSVTLMLEGQIGEQYVSVIPGTFAPGFKVTAAGLTFEQASEIKETTVANTLAANDLVDLGTIGANMSPVSGDGSEANPYLIENLGHMLALASAVDNEETFTGAHFKVMNDIKGVTTPIGNSFFKDPDTDKQVLKPFCGDFDGNGKTITISIDGAYYDYPNRLGLFGVLGGGAKIHDLRIEGSISSPGDAIAAVTGRVELTADDAPVTISNVTNAAVVSGKAYVGGFVAYAKIDLANGLVIDNCQNLGKVTGTGSYVGGIAGQVAGSKASSVTNTTNSGSVAGSNSVAGLIGKASYTKFEDCNNSGIIESTGQDTRIYFTYNGSLLVAGTGTIDQTVGGLATGGICGFLDHGSIKSCTNSGSVTGFVKVGGVVGGIYWSPVSDCTNTATVTGTGSLMHNIASQQGYGFGSTTGGIVGWAFASAAVTDCENSGDVFGKGGLGGIVGFANCNSNSASKVWIANCKNSGKITSRGTGMGGSNKTLNPAVGGIVGSAAAFGAQLLNILNNTNTGNVSTDGIIAGGIAGRIHASRSSGTYVNIVDNCTNSGNVSALYWVGGVIGLANSMWSGIFNITNCMNSGLVAGTRSDDAGEVAGGILGANAIWTANNNNNWTKIRNCCNTGDVVYKTVSHLQPYTGGAVGRLISAGSVQNVSSSGYVGPEGKVAPASGAEKRLGALVGSLEVEAGLKLAYYAEGVCTQIVGTSSKSIDNPDYNIRSFDKYGFLDEYVMFSDEDFFGEVVPALNFWIGTSTDYTQWVWSGAAKAPVFVQ